MSFRSLGLYQSSFRASGSGQGGIQLDTTIGLGPAGVPHALQFVDLRQVASP
jgi:hypothetical protein